MVQFEYDKVMKRYNVKVPFTLAGESSKVTIASMSEDNRITLHREVSIKLLRQVLLSWDEYEHQLKRKDEELAKEWNDMLNTNYANSILKQKGDK